MSFVTPKQVEQNKKDELAELARQGEAFNGLGQRLIVHPEQIGKEKAKLVGYTRATTFIKALDDTTGLEKWRLRLIMEGSLEIDLPGSVADAMAELVANDGNKEAEKLYRKMLDAIAEDAFNAAGGHDPANYGTAVHSLVEEWHRSGDDSDDLRTLLVETEMEWPGVSEDFKAYVDTYRSFAEATGAEVLHSEVLVVNDPLKVAGRTDLVLKARLPGDQRARRILLDVKTGRVDNGMRLSQQLALYAGSKLYDPQTGSRSHLRARQDVAIVAHVPRGEASATFFLVELAPGRRANKLCLDVRASRRKQPGIMQELA